MVHLHCPTLTLTLTQTQTRIGSIGYNSNLCLCLCRCRCSVNTSTQFYATYFLSVSVSVLVLGSVNTFSHSNDFLKFNMINSNRENTKYYFKTNPVGCVLTAEVASTPGLSPQDTLPPRYPTFPRRNMGPYPPPTKDLVPGIP